jgi:hypothetical protein
MRSALLGVLAALAACALTLAGSATADNIGGNNRANNLTGTPRPDLILARGGPDAVNALDGDDTVLAGRGRDRVEGGGGADTIHGGIGIDRLFGERGPDRLMGDAGPDVLHGGGGDDRAYGGAGNDTIYVNLGRDRSYGGPGNDDLWAMAEKDVAGRRDRHGDRLFGGRGNDRFHTRDGERDRIKCGRGNDVAMLDFKDRIVDRSRGNRRGSCEVVRRARPGAEPPGGEQPGDGKGGGPLPSPDFGRGIDPYARYDGQSICDPTEKPGVANFRHLVLRASPGTGDSGIVRACNVGGKSEHKEGRAWDWSANVTNAHQREQVDEVLGQLLRTDRYGNRHALARRIGIMYIIWNRKIWRAYPPGPGWGTYTGSSPHTDHVHFSFSWPGARKHTSYWSKVG